MSEAFRLVLGTAQLGMHYGIANTSGRPDREEAVALVRAAWEGGVREFDTAQAYGDSEIVLGHALGRLGISEKALVVSKPHPDAEFDDEVGAEAMLRFSMNRLGLRQVHGLMLHREDFLDAWDKGVNRALLPLRERGLVGCLGVSVYSVDMALRALETDGIDMVQVPTNLWDRRFETAGVFDLADALGKTVYVRSVYLQGLLLLEQAAVPDHLKAALPYLETLDAMCRETGFSRAALALAYVREAFPGARCVLGAETAQQMRENLALWTRETPADLIDIVRDAFQDVPEAILNPAMWNG